MTGPQFQDREKLEETVATVKEVADALEVRERAYIYRDVYFLKIPTIEVKGAGRSLH